MQTSITFKTQKGVALFIALIALVVLMVAAIALVRSTDTAQLISGNLSVKRDLTHESEIAIAAAINNFATGGLVTEAARWGNLAGANYYASAQASNSQGIPIALVNASATGEASAYNPGVTYSYMIDRMCIATGAPPPLNPANECVTNPPSSGQNGDAYNIVCNGGKGCAGIAGSVVYRASVRLTDARGTQSFFQTTFRTLGTAP